MYLHMAGLARHRLGWDRCGGGRPAPTSRLRPSERASARMSDCWKGSLLRRPIPDRSERRKIPGGSTVPTWTPPGNPAVRYPVRPRYREFGCTRAPPSVRHVETPGAAWLGRYKSQPGRLSRTPHRRGVRSLARAPSVEVAPADATALGGAAQRDSRRCRFNLVTQTV